MNKMVKESIRWGKNSSLAFRYSKVMVHENSIGEPYYHIINESITSHQHMKFSPENGVFTFYKSGHKPTENNPKRALEVTMPETASNELEKELKDNRRTQDLR